MIVFVTGASAGFGAAIARRFAREGHRIVVTGRRVSASTRSRTNWAATKSYRSSSMFATVPPSSPRSKSFPHAFAEIDVLVNNAGLALGLEPAQKADLDEWDAMVDTNVKGLMYVTRAALPGLVARNRGLIVNLGSTAARYPYPGGNVYGATKAFVHQFSLNLRADLIGTRVRVTDIQPGLVGGTEFSSVRFHGDADRVTKLYDGADPLTPEDIAEAVYWVATLPPRVNINAIEMMPVTQASGPLAVHRE